MQLACMHSSNNNLDNHVLSVINARNMPSSSRTVPFSQGLLLKLQPYVGRQLKVVSTMLLGMEHWPIV